MEDDFIGKFFINKAGFLFIVTNFISSDQKNRYYEVLFPYTGYKTIITKSQIINSTVKDRFLPTVAGVGYLGNATAPRGDRFYSVWHNMLHRCYNPNFNEFKRYGALGVKVCLRWHSFENFKNDLPFIEGYNEELFNKGLIQLDKDKKQFDIPIQYRIYSPYTCTFLTIAENNFYSSTHYPFRAIDPYGNEYIGDNLPNFCRLYQLDLHLVHQVINGFQKTTANGWRFEKI